MTAIVDYDTGNLRSVADAMRRIGAEFTITAYPALLRGADRCCCPAWAKLRRRWPNSASGDSIWSSPP